MPRISFLFLLLGALVALASASAPVFCKCTCNKNSTIVPLDPNNNHASLERRDRRADLFGSFPPVILAPLPGIPSTSSSSSSGRKSKRNEVSTRGAPSSTCAQCTKAFCLAQDLDICKDATEEVVQTMCFQRDSNKDKIIVWGFMLGTGGLLAWAAARKVMERREAQGLGAGGGYSFLRGRN